LTPVGLRNWTGIGFPVATSVSLAVPSGHHVVLTRWI
jgi:hypothetical protein